MRPRVQRDGTERVHILEQNYQVSRRLDELCGIRRLHNSRDAGQPAIRRWIVFGVVIGISGLASRRVGHQVFFAHRHVWRVLKIEESSEIGLAIGRSRNGLGRLCAATRRQHQIEPKTVLHFASLYMNLPRYYQIVLKVEFKGGATLPITWEPQTLHFDWSDLRSHWRGARAAGNEKSSHGRSGRHQGGIFAVP